MHVSLHDITRKDHLDSESRAKSFVNVSQDEIKRPLEQILRTVKLEIAANIKERSVLLEESKTSINASLTQLNSIVNSQLFDLSYILQKPEIVRECHYGDPNMDACVNICNNVLDNLEMMNVDIEKINCASIGKDSLKTQISQLMLHNKHLCVVTCLRHHYVIHNIRGLTILADCMIAPNDKPPSYIHLLYNGVI